MPKICRAFFYTALILSWFFSACVNGSVHSGGTGFQPYIVRVNKNALSDKDRLEAVTAFAENVLAYGRDRYRDPPTPLFADGINVESGDQVTWRVPGGPKAIISDMACQQNLFRTLSALSLFTKKEKYKDAAIAAIKYHFDNLVDTSGLLQWGGHRFIDLKTLALTGPGGKGQVHELKNCFPYYELMFEVDPGKTAQYIRAFWNAHVYDWKELYVGRHGNYGLHMGELFKHPLVNLPPLRESPGLSFINAGSDLIYAAALLYHYTGDNDALNWSKHLAYQYVAARNQNTGLGAYQFTQPKKKAEATSDDQTESWYGDRAGRQFGPDFGAIALEANVLFFGAGESIYCENALMELKLGGDLGKDGKDFLDWPRSGLASYARYAYDEKINSFKPMFTDGKDLTGYTFLRNGYYGKKGMVLRPVKALGKFLLSYSRGFLATRDKDLWNMARAIGRGNNLGDLGSEPGHNLKLNLSTDNYDARALFAILDLWRATDEPSYLELGRVVGNNIVKKYYNNGFFTPGPNYINAHFDVVEPLALLCLEAALEGKIDAMPSFIDGNGYIDGDYQFTDGTVRGITDETLWNMKK